MNRPPDVGFPALDAIPGVKTGFIGRIPAVDVDTDRSTALARLADPHQARLSALGFAAMPFATAEQVHGDTVAAVTKDSVFPVPACDGLVTCERRLCLGIYVADCAAVYLADRHGRAVGLVHSGKKGTELGIVKNAVAAVCEVAGAAPADLIAAISPCIRPPHYEIDFAAGIRAQLRDAGLTSIHDDGICTASRPDAFYSYRREQGRTGRMLAVIALL